MSDTDTSSNRIPACVAELLARLEQANGNLAGEHPDGPYMLEALLRDVRLCPSIGGGPVAPDVDDLAKRLSTARDAARVVLTCQISSRDFAVERLNAAIAAARDVVSRRVDDAEASGNRAALSSPRCRSCAFA